MPLRAVTQLRLDDNLYLKIKFIAEREKRSLNAQLEYFLAKSIEQYEAQNGNINITISADFS